MGKLAEIIKNSPPPLKRRCGYYGELAKMAFKSQNNPCPVCGRRLGEETSFDKDLQSFTQWKRWCNKCNYREDYDSYTKIFTMKIDDTDYSWRDGISDEAFTELSVKIRQSMANYKLKLGIPI